MLTNDKFNHGHSFVEAWWDRHWKWLGTSRMESILQASNVRLFKLAYSDSPWKSKLRTCQRARSWKCALYMIFGWNKLHVPSMRSPRQFGPRLTWHLCLCIFSRRIRISMFGRTTSNISMSEHAKHGPFFRVNHDAMRSTCPFYVF